MIPPLRNGVGEHSFLPLPHIRKVERMRKVVLLLGSMVAAMLLVSGVALADHLANTVQCTTDPFTDCVGTEENDHMYGTDERELIYALGGDDQIDAYGHFDHVDGGPGNDTLYGGSGSDNLLGASENDRLYGGTEVDSLYGQQNDDFLHGGGSGDLLEGNMGKDQLQGGDGADDIVTGNDTVVDTVDCGSGNDVVWFHKGIDKINSNCEKKRNYSAS